MLSDVRKALAATIADTLSELEAKVVDHPPKSLEAGVYVYVQPDPGSYVAAWRSFGPTGRGEIRYQIVLCVQDNGNPSAAWDALDDLIDPISTAPNVFGALTSATGGPVTLDVDGVEATAAPLLEDVAAPQLVAAADGAVSYYELTLPVSVMVQRS